MMKRLAFAATAAIAAIMLSAATSFVPLVQGEDLVIDTIVDIALSRKRFEALSLANCPTTRSQLSSNPGYVTMLHTLRQDMYELEIGAIMRARTQQMTLLGALPNIVDDYEEQPVAYWVEEISAVLFATFYPTSFIQIVVDLLRLVCEGIEEDRKPPEASEVEILISRMRRRIRVDTIKGRRVYTRINGGLPMLVFERFLKLLDLFIRIPPLFRKASKA